ncbi:MAG: SUMF1/EgtB/PvdO family nonheme iron enzyme, partial [Rubripirellula sp.]|nr:SUMF1/EgtB/PvdO family nonheme iron enzyme [Rubripirellula sp.]
QLAVLKRSVKRPKLRKRDLHHQGITAMKTQLGLLLLVLLIAVGCDDSSQSEQSLESITNTICMKLNVILAGAFMMGSPETEEHRDDDEFQHKVTISKAFYMQTTEVTQGKWTAVMGTASWKGQPIMIRPLK